VQNEINPWATAAGNSIWGIARQNAPDQYLLPQNARQAAQMNSA